MQFDLFTFLASLFNFIVLLVVLRIFLFKRVTNAMDEREQRIESTWDEAEEEKDQAQRLKSEYEQKMQAAEDERAELFQEAKQQAEAERKEKLEKLRREIDERREEWLADLKEQNEQLISEIDREVARATVSAVQRALGKLADRSLEEQMVHVLARRVRGEWADQLKEHVDGAAIEITTSDELSNEQQDELRTAFEDVGNPEAVRFEVDGEMVCGARVRIGDKELGWSIADETSEIENRVNRLVRETANA
ncbi:MAG: F0F1 ATP synthase subunit delta [Spirochaetales bacterium]